MRNLGLGAVAVTLVMVGTACSDSLAPESIAGAYMVSVWELTSVETPSQQEEWIAGGVNIRFEIGADGSFAITATWDHQRIHRHDLPSPCPRSKRVSPVQRPDQQKRRHTDVDVP
jgi:hypothetical protein